MADGCLAASYITNHTLFLVVHNGENTVIFGRRFLTFAPAGNIIPVHKPGTLHVENFSRHTSDAATPGD
jgi:hypothetical protein